MALRKRATVVPAPINVQPSQSFDGNDGQWSTFVVSVGTPPQNFRVLISTQSSETWVISPEGCTTTDVANCQTLRGGQPFNGQAPQGFLSGSSSTWQQAGIYTLDTEKTLNYSGNGLFGYDVVGINGGNSSSSTGGISLPNKVVAAMPAKDYFLGIFGLGIRDTSFSSGAPDAPPSFMVTLKENNQIPSKSYGYTAGAPYQNKQTFGSLVLGGYDTTRFSNTTAPKSLTFSANDARQLIVGVQSIVAINTLKGTASMTTSGGHLSLIDSTVPHLWLPREICDNFEQSLGLTYDPATDLYRVNDTAHQQLLSLNPTFTFKLGNTAFDDGNATNIELPYAAFDLQVGWPIYSQNVNYFPIRRAANDTQYTLGRTLLQQAYIIVDFERSNFTIAPALFPDSSVQPSIVAIHSTGKSSSAKTGLGVGAIVGIVVGGVAVLALIFGLLFWFRRKKKLQKAEISELEAKQANSNTAYGKLQPHSDVPDDVYETDGAQIQELEGPGFLGVGHKDGAPTPQELPSPAPVFEMEGESTLSSYGRQSGNMGRYSPAQISPYRPGGDSR